MTFLFDFEFDTNDGIQPFMSNNTVVFCSEEDEQQRPRKLQLQWNLDFVQPEIPRYLCAYFYFIFIVFDV